MNLCDYARAIVGSSSLEEKLRPPPKQWTDTQAEPELVTRPGRPKSLAIRPASEVKVPRIDGMKDLAQRPRILHAMANHELQAIELFAWALLAFPDTPPPFRRGLLAILVEEQRHCQLYIDRVNAYGVGFGDLPVSGYFWNRAGAIRTPIQFACTMGLTFENANLDFAQEYAAAARAVGDDATAAAIDEIHTDEVRHVAFGWQWLERWKDPKTSMWDAYTAELQRPLGPEHARGKSFDVEGRRAAGLDDEFIAKLRTTVPRGPGGAPR